MKNFIIVLSLYFVLTGYASASGVEKFKESLPTNEGQLIFEESGCVMCHGQQGLGDGLLAEGLDPKPRNFASYEQMNRVPYQSMYSAIKNGIPYSAMPAFDLSEKQIDAVISYVRSFLTENYITINTCSNVAKVVSLENLDLGEQFDIEVDKKNFVSTTIKEKKLTLTPNFIDLLKTFKSEQKQIVRLNVNLTRKKNGKKKYLAIIVLRINDCVK